MKYIFLVDVLSGSTPLKPVTRNRLGGSTWVEQKKKWGMRWKKMEAIHSFFFLVNDFNLLFRRIRANFFSVMGAKIRLSRGTRLDRCHMMLVPGTVTGIIRTKGVPMHLECSSSLWSRAVRMDVASLNLGRISTRKSQTRCRVDSAFKTR